METPERIGAALDATGFVPIAEAARRLGRVSVWTLKRWHREGHLPAVISQGRWFVPESFLAMVAASPQPGRAGVLEDVAAQWFAAHSATAEVVA